MIVGIGTDLCDVRRIAAALQRHGVRFAARILGPQEQAVWMQRSQRWPERGVRYLGTRFAAKEAFSKAIGLGMRSPMTWRDCEIVNRPGGQPSVVLHGALRRWCDERGWRAHVSVSDEGDFVAAFVVVERDGAVAPALRWPAAVPADEV
ncbi:holo-ACP synthase [Tepidimonas sp.]|uniref:holo-ACP synthase n=1 Tax=Tepidimonas sp. TaxID=2002775 RepID=UPI002FE35B74